METKTQRIDCGDVRVIEITKGTRRILFQVMGFVKR